MKNINFESKIFLLLSNFYFQYFKNILKINLQPLTFTHNMGGAERTLDASPESLNPSYLLTLHSRKIDLAYFG